MGSDRLILGFDTSAAHCAAALLCGDRLRSCRAETMARGQAERLMPLLEQVLAEAGATWRDLAAIGVGVGPGNFTGIRIAVSAARGLALGLGVPAIGVSGFQARAAAGALAAIPAPRDQLFVAPPGAAPALLPAAEARALAEGLGLRLAADTTPESQAEAIAREAARALARGETGPPVPCYLRPADAAPARDAPPVILDP